MNRLDDIRTICLEPNGDISLCRGFLLGNTRDTPIHTLLNTYNPYTESDMRLILQEGVEGVVKTARALGIAFRKDGYYSLCDLCTSLKQDISTSP